MDARRMMFPFGSIRPADRKANKNLLEHCICLRKIENKDEKQSDEMETGLFSQSNHSKKTKLKSSITTLQDLKNLMLESCFQIDSTLSKVVKDRKEEVAQRSGEQNVSNQAFDFYDMLHAYLHPSLYMHDVVPHKGMDA